MNNHRHAWRATVSGMIALAVAMGIGRFVFTPLLPMMQHDSGLSVTQGGWLASANYLGYLAGALSCIWLTSRPEIMIRTGLLLTAALTFGMGMTHDFSVWLVLRTLAGIASAWVLVYSSAWTLHELAAAQQPRLASLVFAGVGVGIFVSGLLGAWLVKSHVTAAAAWQIFGGLALLLSLSVRLSTGAAGTAVHAAAAAPVEQAPRWSGAALRLIFCYGIAGFGYIIPATFLPLVAKQAVEAPVLTTLFWPLFGLAAMVMGVLLLRLPDVAGNRPMLATCLISQAAGNLVLALVPGVAGVAIGTVLVACVFLAIVQFTMREARHIAVGNASWLMGALTAAYGLGQIAGPPLASHLASQTGSFAGSLLVAAAALSAGAVAAFPEPLLRFTGRKKGETHALR